MLRGYQGGNAKALALGISGLVAALLILFWGYWIGSGSGYYEGEANSYSHQRAHDTQGEIDACLASGNAATKECFIEAVESQRADQRSEADLHAQREMSNWAFWLLIISVVQFLVSGLGLLALLRTIEQGSRALTRAKRANRIASNTAKKQLRCYVHIERAWLDFRDEGSPRFHLKIINTGQTPAKYFEIAGRVCMMSTKADDRSTLPTFSNFKRWAVVGAGACKFAALDPENVGMVSETVFRKPHPGTELFLLAVVRAEDIFGDIWETEFTAFVHRAAKREAQGLRMISANSNIRAFEKIPQNHTQN